MRRLYPGKNNKDSASVRMARIRRAVRSSQARPGLKHRPDNTRSERPQAALRSPPTSLSRCRQGRGFSRTDRARTGSRRARQVRTERRAEAPPSCRIRRDRGRARPKRPSSPKSLPSRAGSRADRSARRARRRLSSRLRRAPARADGRCDCRSVPRARTTRTRARRDVRTSQKRSFASFRLNPCSFLPV